LGALRAYCKQLGRACVVVGHLGGPVAVRCRFGAVAGNLGRFNLADQSPGPGERGRARALLSSKE
jgi:hypothetical protein